MEKEKMFSDNVFSTLNGINVTSLVKEKGKQTYLPWAIAWKLTKVSYPMRSYSIIDRPNGCNYFTDGRTAWVKVSVTIGSLTHVEQLPVLDYSNKSITVDKITSADINRAHKRALVKCLAAGFGLGINLYEGEEWADSFEVSKAVSKMMSARAADKALLDAEPVRPKDPKIIPMPEAEMEWEKALNTVFTFNFPAAKGRKFGEILEMSEDQLGMTAEKLLTTCSVKNEKDPVTGDATRAARFILSVLEATA